MKKVIWFINQYSSTPETAYAGRHYYLAQELARQGHEVYVIAGSFSHLLRQPKVVESDYLIEQVENNFKFIWIKLPSYENAHSKSRIFNEFRFSYKIAVLLKSLIRAPDAIVYSSPALIGYLGGKHLANFFKAKFAFEVRDPWPLTLVELGGYSVNHPFVRFLQWIEDSAYRKSDYVFSNFFNAIEHMLSRGMESDKFHWIPNGISLSEVENKLDLDTVVKKNIPKDKFIVGYTGTLGVANAIEYLIEAAELVSDIENIHFLIVGDGKEKGKLKEISEAKKLKNITFIDSIPKRQVQSMLDNFDACYLGWQKNKMYNLGIAANKLPEYLYSGKPIIHSFSGAGDFVVQANAGFSVEAENPVQIAEAIRKVYFLSEDERLKLGLNGKKFVLENFDYKKLAERLERILL